ncbi:MAG: DUF2752 domain-containing protein [Clostridia bacterium]|nr:DUF2752 domain-containing protein [Clostridia bacterium]
MSKKKEIIILLTLGILYFIFFIKFEIGFPCVFYKITHLYCPGCGMTRSIVSLIKFNFYQAVRYNMLIVLAIPVGILLIIYKGKIPDRVYIILLVIVIIFGIMRNIPSFSFLAPTKII